MRTMILASAFIFAAGGTALADRPLTDAERARLVQAVAAEGCSGGKMEFDASKSQSDKFEVDDAMCADGKKYDLEFDQAFKLLKKKLDS